jgi:RNA polymerase sigma-70 factor (ECF subfamily)
MIVDLKGLSPERWSEFVAVYSKWLRYYIRHEGVPREAVDDVLQDVLKSLYDSIGKFERNPKLGKFRGWMRNIIRYKAADYRRKLPKGKVEFDLDYFNAVEDPLAESMLDHSTDEESRSNDEDSKILREAVTAAMNIVRNKVKPKTWEMFERRELNEENSADIAADLGVTSDNIRMSVSRVKAKLREILRDDFAPKS